MYGRCSKSCAIGTQFYDLYQSKESLLSPLVSGVAGVLAIVLGVCLKWAILPPVVDFMVR